MAGVEVKRFDAPDDVWQFGDRGRSEIVRLGDRMVVRSILEPGWSWIEDIKPQAEGLENCPLHHREYVVAGHIRYEVVETGESVEASAGAYLDIQPRHLASVVGNETCVLVDFDEDWGD